MTTVVLSDGIRLLSGAMFDYARPADSDVRIDDIAAALSKVCRFAGHIHRFYSVAQHALNVSLIVSPELAFTALMHDTAEAFTNDLPTPLKHALPVFRELEDRIEAAMARRFCFQWPLPAAIKIADLQMLAIEKELLKRDTSDWSVLAGIDHSVVAHLPRMEPMAPEQAEIAFLDRYYEVCP